VKKLLIYPSFHCAPEMRDTASVTLEARKELMFSSSGSGVLDDDWEFRGGVSA
jgi:hypothetical protein